MLPWLSQFWTGGKVCIFETCQDTNLLPCSSVKYTDLYIVLQAMLFDIQCTSEGSCTFIHVYCTWRRICLWSWNEVKTQLTTAV